MTHEGYPKPPDRLVVNTGEEEKIEKEKDRFFVEILDFLGYTRQARVALAEILPMVLHRYDSSGQVRPTDNRITLLIIRDRVAAFVLERRDDFNYVEVVFANCLDTEVVRRLREGL